MSMDLAIAIDEPWMADARCSQVDPEIFFPEKGGSDRDPKAVCGRCSVTAQCLQYSLDHNERFGIWGGVSERDRRKLKRANTPPKEPIMTDTTSDTTEILLPDYIVELAELLTATEGHRDPLVRATRKIVIQAAIALDQAQAASPAACRECGCTDTEACFPTCSWVEPNLCSACSDTPQSSGPDETASLPDARSTSTCGPEAPTKQKRKSSAAVLLMTEHQVQAADVRTWATSRGIAVAGRGGLPVDLVQRYLTERGAA